MENEILLTGGRVTQGVVRKGSFVHRPLCENSGFVHEVLLFLEESGLSCAPFFCGIDDQNREKLTFIEGTSPDNLGRFTEEQCRLAVLMIKTVHICLSGFPDCPPGLTVCHNDLSPCNFIFSGDEPVAIIDWDAAAFGDPLDDLAYAVWMWLDIGNDENSFGFVHARTEAMLDAYGVSAADRHGFGARVLRQMERVGRGVFPTEEQTNATRQWVAKCRMWYENLLQRYR